MLRKFACSTLAAAGLLGAAALPAAAQDAAVPQTTAVIGGIVVTVPQIRGPNASPTGAEVETVTVSQNVDYADLDLRTPEGADDLYDRVTHAATAACKASISRNPVGAPDERLCAQDAVYAAMPQMISAIGEARGW